jgi:hypothetical protein
MFGPEGPPLGSPPNLWLAHRLSAAHSRPGYQPRQVVSLTVLHNSHSAIGQLGFVNLA